MSTTEPSVVPQITEHKRGSLAGIITVGVVALGAVVLFGYWTSRSNAKKGSLNITLGKDVSVKMDVENDSQSMREVLDRVFADERAKRETQSLLADSYDLYSPRDERLLQAFSRLSASDSVAQRLKDMVLKHKRPFGEELRPVRISFAGNSVFPDADAVVCDGSDFLERKIYLYDSQEQREVIVNADRWRACSRPADGNPVSEAIQITFNTARKLFGDRPLNGFEVGWAGFGPLSK